MRLVQLSDPHIVAPEKQPIHGYDTIARLHRAVTAVNRLDPAPDVVLMTGDLTNDEEAASYKIVKSSLSNLIVPAHLALGNHDARLPFRAVMLDESDPRPDRYYYTFYHDDCRVIVLDTLDEGHIPGEIDDAQLAWLDETLKTGHDTFTIVCCHHPPVKVGVPWMDELMLRDADRLLHIIDKYPAVRLVLSGHVHCPFRIERNHYTCFTAPAVSVQFHPKPMSMSDKTEADSESVISDAPPAFRIIDIHNGEFETSIHPVADG